MKKHLFKTVFVIVVVFAIIASALFVSKASNEPSIVLSSVQGEEGEEVEVALSLNNNPGITALSVNIAYPSEGYELISIENAGLFESSISTSQLSRNPVTLSWFAADSGNKNDSGDLAILKFKIKDGAKSGDITLSYDEDNIFNNSMENVSFQTVNGKITVDKPQQTNAPETEFTIPSDVPAFCLSTVTGVRDEEAQVSLSLINNPGITALSIDISYPSDDFELLSIEDAGLFANPVSTSQLSKNPITISWFAADSGNKTNSGELAVLKFKVKSKAKSGKISLTYDEDNVFNNSFENISFYTVDGEILIDQHSDPVIGDTDGDGEVNSIDVTNIQRYCASMHLTIPESTLMMGDVDKNGILDIIDATYIQRWLAHIQIPYAIG